jgi:hypothetical protein
MELHRVVYLLLAVYINLFVKEYNLNSKHKNCPKHISSSEMKIMRVLLKSNNYCALCVLQLLLA